MTKPRRQFRIPLYMPFVALAILYLAFSLYFQFALRTLFEDYENKLFSDRKYVLDLICSEGEEFVDEPEFERIMKNLFAKIDTRSGTYGALYNGDMRLLSERTPQFPGHPFDPLEHPNLLTMMKVLDSGEIDIWFEKPDVAGHILHVYFRKIGSYVAFIGVTQYAIEPWFSSGVTSMAVVLMIAACVCCLFCFLAVWAERRYRANERVNINT